MKKAALVWSAPRIARVLHVQNVGILRVIAAMVESLIMTVAYAKGVTSTGAGRFVKLVCDLKVLVLTEACLTGKHASV